MLMCREDIRFVETEQEGRRAVFMAGELDLEGRQRRKASKREYEYLPR